MTCYVVCNVADIGKFPYLTHFLTFTLLCNVSDAPVWTGRFTCIHPYPVADI